MKVDTEGNKLAIVRGAAERSIMFALRLFSSPPIHRQTGDRLDKVPAYLEQEKFVASRGSNFAALPLDFRLAGYAQFL